MIPFSLGRVFTYTLIAFIAFSGSAFIKEALKNSELFHMLLGSVTIILGLYMLYQSYKSNQSCGLNHHKNSNKPITKGGFFLLGASMSINLCAPIATLITMASTRTSTISAIFLGLFFGIGATLFTLLFYGFFLSNLIRGILEQFQSYKRAVEIIASMSLITVGVFILSGQISL